MDHLKKEQNKEIWRRCSLHLLFSSAFSLLFILCCLSDFGELLITIGRLLSLVVKDNPSFLPLKQLKEVPAGGFILFGYIFFLFI